MRKIILALALLGQSAYAMPFTAYDFISLVYSGVRFAQTESIPEEIVITETGIGKNQNDAVEQALNNAIQRGIGILVVSDQTVNDAQVIRNLVASYTSGVVNSYEIQHCRKDNIVTCTVKAKVSPWKFMRKLEGDANTIKVNGNNLYAQAMSAKVAMEQRRKMAEYYFSSIRPNGLEAKIREVKILPSTGENVRMAITYEVKWNSDYKKSIIAFLEKLENDTKGETNEQIYIQWGPTGLFENRVRINTSDSEFRRMVLSYLYQPIQIKINELGLCQTIEPKGDVFKIDWYGLKEQIVIEVNEKQLKKIDQLSISTSCRA